MLINKICSRFSLTACLIIIDTIVALALIEAFLLKPAELEYVQAWNNLYIISPQQEIKKIALTFDDGPHPLYTEQILDILKEKDVKATFFIMGQNAEKYPHIVKRISDEGHLIGNHTYNHIQLNSHNFDTFEHELKKTTELLESITGNTVEYVRPPYGPWNINFEKRTNLLPVMWSIDTLDWCTIDAQIVVKRVMTQPKDNDIVLMHDGYQSTVTATEMIIDQLLEEGFSFVTADEILLD